MKILVTGANGLLGSAVTEEVLRRGHTCIATGRAPQPRCADATVYAQADLCDPQAVQALITDTQPDAVIHCAAWTDVDGAELPENRGAGVRHQRRRHEKRGRGLPRHGLQDDLHHDGLRL